MNIKRKSILLALFIILIPTILFAQDEIKTGHDIYPNILLIDNLKADDLQMAPRSMNQIHLYEKIQSQESMIENQKNEIDQLKDQLTKFDELEKQLASISKSTKVMDEVLSSFLGNTFRLFANEDWYTIDPREFYGYAMKLKKLIRKLESKEKTR